MTPAQELLTAAARLRTLAAAATPGPWTLTKNLQRNTRSHMQSTWTRPGLAPQSVKPSQHSDYAWITLMGPDKAELLADWLETEAACLGAGEEAGNAMVDLVDSVAGQPAQTTFSITIDTSGPALAFARAILAQETP